MNASCFSSGDGWVTGPVDPLEACKLAVRASIFFSSSATRLSVFFCLLRVGWVTMQLRPAFAHRLHGPSGLARAGSRFEAGHRDRRIDKKGPTQHAELHIPRLSPKENAARGPWTLRGL